MVDKKDVRAVETYTVNVHCPYCGESNSVEEDYDAPEDHTCYYCEKHFNIKYQDTPKPKPKKSKSINK